MSDLAIRIKNLSKLYRIGVKSSRNDTLREALANTLLAPVRALRSAVNGRPSSVGGPRSPVEDSRSSVRGPQSSVSGQPSSVGGHEDTMWALKDISFEVKQGEVVGIIGRNGAGKSTLLKILSRVTDPTEGKAEIYGRVGSLLDVGAGFHAELTGRENVYLSGAILGMARAEVAHKFEEIVAFAEVGTFIDTPVKRYSSGMYVRLGFAVAAHMEPEILIVDEALSVGDAGFQKKCLDKVREVARQGRTVLMVSHNMAVVQSLGKRTLMLERGRVVLDGKSEEVIGRYLNMAKVADSVQEDYVDLRNHPGRLANMTPALTRMWMTDGRNTLLKAATMGGEIIIHVEYSVEGNVPRPIVGLTFETPLWHRVFGINNRMSPGAMITDGTPRGRLSCHVPRLPLVAGEYYLTVAFARSADANVDKIVGAFRLKVLPADVYGTGHMPVEEDGNCVLDGHWIYTPQ